MTDEMGIFHCSQMQNLHILNPFLSVANAIYQKLYLKSITYKRMNPGLYQAQSVLNLIQIGMTGGDIIVDNKGRLPKGDELSVLLSSVLSSLKLNNAK